MAATARAAVASSTRTNGFIEPKALKRVHLYYKDADGGIGADTTTTVKLKNQATAADTAAPGSGFQYVCYGMTVSCATTQIVQLLSGAGSVVWEHVFAVTTSGGLPATQINFPVNSPLEFGDNAIPHLAAAAAAAVYIDLFCTLERV